MGVAGLLLISGVLAAFVGALAGAAELAARYRDDPLRALGSGPATLYMLINGLAAFAAVYLLEKFAPTLARAAGETAPDIVTLVLAAGFGSLAVLRMSVIKLKVGSDEVSVGPALVLEQILKVVDRGIDRHMAARRAEIAEELAGAFSFAECGQQLVSICIGLLQNASAEEQTRMTDVARVLAGSELSDRGRSANLILALLGLVGEKVLRSAIKVAVKRS